MSLINRFAALRSVRAAARIVGNIRSFAEPLANWLRIKTPVFGRLAVERRRRVVLPPYARPATLRGSLLQIAAAPGLAIFCMIYGFLFGLTAPVLIVAFVAPLAVLALLIIWALPGQRNPPTVWIEFLMPAFFVALIIWPNYIAISLPGIPWITLLRILLLPLSGCLIISLSVSRPFRDFIVESVNSVKILWITLLAFSTIQFLTIFVSRQPGPSAQLVFNDQMYWTVIFIVSCAIFRDIRNVERYFGMLCSLSIPIIIITILESREQHILWVNQIPKILQIHDPSVTLTLTPSFRPILNIYRAKSTFSTQLQLAEYLALITPFFLHFGSFSRNYIIRILSFLMVPLVFFTIRLTDTRLGIAGMFVALLLYGVIWSVIRWRSRPRDILAAAIVYAYPLLFVGAVSAVFVSNRMHTLVFGGGAQVGSTAARSTQLNMAIQKLASRPWGFGAGQSGEAIGYADGAFKTVDNYFISIALDHGILGAALWYMLFIAGIITAARFSLSSKYVNRSESRLLSAISVALAAFLVMKWVHGQDYTHPIPFMMLGMISALVFRLRNMKDENSGEPSGAPQIVQVGRRAWTSSSLRNA